MNKFVIVNGEVVKKNEVNLSHLFWEDHEVFSRKMWFGFGGIPLFSENVDLLIKEIEILKLPCPALLKNKRELFRITKRMLNKNKFYRSGYVHFKFLWKKENLNSLISSEPFETFDFPLSEKVILVNYSEYKKFSQNPFTAFSFFNESFWRLIKAQNSNSIFQNSIISNENQAVCEAISENLFFISGKTLVTPSLKTGCFEDILRSAILEIAKKTGLKVKESSHISKKDILKMDEIFTLSESTGMHWILGVENKRYIRNISVKIHEQLNEYLKEKAGE